MNLLTPGKSKTSSALKSQKKEGKHHGSYNIDTLAGRKFDESEATPSYKRQDSRGNSSSLVTFTSDGASPLLKDGPLLPSTKQTPKPLPPPRVSSLKKPSVNNDSTNIQAQNTEQLQTPRCRRPILMGLSPMLESPIEISSGEEATATTKIQDISAMNQSTTSSVIENEANLLLNGEMDPSDSMTHFLDGGNNPDNENISENNSPNLAITKITRKRSPQPQNCGNNTFGQVHNQSVVEANGGYNHTFGGANHTFGPYAPNQNFNQNPNLTFGPQAQNPNLTFGPQSQNQNLGHNPNRTFGPHAQNQNISQNPNLTFGPHGGNQTNDFSLPLLYNSNQTFGGNLNHTFGTHAQNQNVGKNPNQTFGPHGENQNNEFALPTYNHGE